MGRGKKKSRQAKNQNAINNSNKEQQNLMVKKLDNPQALDTDLSDCIRKKVHLIIKSKSHKFSTSSNLVCKYSKYIENHLKANPKHTIFDLEHIADCDMRILMIFFHTHRVEITEKNAYPLLHCALTLQIQELVNHICRFLTRHYVADSCVLLYLKCRDFKQVEWQAVCQRHIIDNFEQAINQAKLYSDFEFEDFAPIIQHSELNVSTETVVYLAVIEWLKSNWPERQDHLEFFLELIRFPLLKLAFIKHRVLKEEILENNPVAHMVISEALAMHHTQLEMKTPNFPTAN